MKKANKMAIAILLLLIGIGLLTYVVADISTLHAFRGYQGSTSVIEGFVGFIIITVGIILLGD
jgi:hypothetical protein